MLNMTGKKQDQNQSWDIHCKSLTMYRSVRPYSSIRTRDSQYMQSFSFNFQNLLIALQTAHPLYSQIQNFSGAYQNFSGAYQNISGAYQNISGGYQNFSGAYQNISGAYQNFSGAYQNISGAYQRSLCK